MTKRIRMFAVNELAANGQLALALAIAALERLPPMQVEQALNEAERILPDNKGRTDNEAMATRA